MIRRPPRSTHTTYRRQRPMCIRDSVNRSKYPALNNYLDERYVESYNNALYIVFHIFFIISYNKHSYVAIDALHRCFVTEKNLTTAGNFFNYISNNTLKGVEPYLF
jgi:hypothetical protein